MEKLIVIGIDSLDPYILTNYRDYLPNFSQIMAESKTFISSSVFPVDTIPAWGSIYTGLNPANHGLLYVYDVFDPNLSDLRKLNVNYLKNKTFWDFASAEKYEVGVMYPMLMYPAWEVNGIMVSKSPFDKRIDWVGTEIDINAYPENVYDKYMIPHKMDGVWGGFPGINHLKEWSEKGKSILKEEKDLGLKIFNAQNFDLFFIYFSLLDIIQHRLWRFFDKKDPNYPGENEFGNIILDYYKIFDEIIGEYKTLCPDAGMLIISDHGHRSRPFKKVNINEYLRKNQYLVSSSKKSAIQSRIKNIILGISNSLNIEHLLIKIVVKNKKMTQIGKSVYSSSGLIDQKNSKCFLSNFAGIKSYSYGGIEINKENISKKEYNSLMDNIIFDITNMKDNENKNIFNWVKPRNELYNGIFTNEIFPDIVFELRDDLGVGWDLFSGLNGRSYDHNVASGGHGKDAVFLISNINKNIEDRKINLIDIAPTILDYFNISRGSNFDGKSIFQ